MDDAAYRKLITANLGAHRSNPDEESLVRTIKAMLEVMETLPGGGPLPDSPLSVELWRYYMTVRIPQRARARGLWLKGLKGAMNPVAKRAKGPSGFLHLTDKALADFLGEPGTGANEAGVHEYLGGLNNIERSRVQVTVDAGRFKVGTQVLDGVYRYVLAPTRLSGLQLWAYPEGDNSWKHSQFLRGAPVFCAGMLYVFRGRLVEISNGSGHYQPPDTAIEKVKDWMRAHGITLTPDQIDTTGSKATKGEDLFQWVAAQERFAKRRFESYEQVMMLREKYDKLGMVAKVKAQREGMKWT